MGVLVVFGGKEMWGGVSEVVGRMWGVWEEREEEEKCSNERRKRINKKKTL